jgi:carbohydrate-selective porin OprB
MLPRQVCFVIRVLKPAILTALLLAGSICAEESDYLFGSLGGAREYIESSGLETEVILTHDIIGNASGGSRRGVASLGTLDLTLALDTEKASLWKGGTFFMYALTTYGDEVTSLVGDLQASDNIEAFSTEKLYELWYNQSLFDGKINLLGGLFDLNSEFATLEHAGALLNSSFGISPDMSQVGISIYPTTSPAVRLRISPAENFYFSTAAFDGIPGSEYDESGTQVSLQKDDGAFLVQEFGYANDFEDFSHYKKFAFGYWELTTDHEDYRSEQRGSEQPR